MNKEKESRPKEWNEESRRPGIRSQVTKLKFRGLCFVDVIVVVKIEKGYNPSSLVYFID
jgi:hypothetical protein